MAKIQTFKDLPKRDPYAGRGDDGTLVYAPDIAVFIDTDEHGIVDLGPSITNFSLTRNINQVSTFQCSFDNKWRKWDRTIKRMNRVVVFLKRIAWLQVFSGYITQAPWETVTPGDAQMMAECTLKRLVHTYWDPQAAEAANLFPMFAIDGSWKYEDGGAATSLYRVLTEVANWPDNQIFIQKLPESWMRQAFKAIQKNKNEINPDDPNEVNMINDALKLLFENRGWNGQTSGSNTSNNQLTESDYERAYDPGELPAEHLTELRFTDANGRDIYVTYSTYPNSNENWEPIQLRNDAADSFKAAFYEIAQHNLSVIEDKILIKRDGRWWAPILQCGYRPTEESFHLGMSCPVKEFGYGNRIDIDEGVLGSLDLTVLENYGWERVPGTIKGFTFTGTHIDFELLADINLDITQSGDDMAATNALFFWPGFSLESVAYTGSRAWINDVPVLESIQQLASAAMRDFQSGPDGSFIAFYPDRIGITSTMPALKVHNIEVRDFKTILSDAQLVTHLVSVGDFLPPQDVQVQGQELMNVLLLGGVVSVEQEGLMAMLLGIDEKDAKGIAKFMMERFGIRPMKQNNFAIRNAGWNFAVALHRFQEFWANQWQVMVTFTFLPEVYPGMRIEMMDNNPPIGVYVEGVTHTGSRTGGFLSQVTISTPTRWDPKQKKWVMLQSEYERSGPANMPGDTEPKPDNTPSSNAWIAAHGG